MMKVLNYDELLEKAKGSMRVCLSEVVMSLNPSGSGKVDESKVNLDVKRYVLSGIYTVELTCCFNAEIKGRVSAVSYCNLGDSWSVQGSDMKRFTKHVMFDQAYNQIRTFALAAWPFFDTTLYLAPFAYQDAIKDLLDDNKVYGPDDFPQS
ncbi:MAG: hypothetical protein Q4P66_09970 [Actinomycetaceae bacterium]|nr:hypothetical protein [Actinomycetaceae bacterium]